MKEQKQPCIKDLFITDKTAFQAKLSQEQVIDGFIKLVLLVLWLWAYNSNAFSALICSLKAKMLSKQNSHKTRRLTYFKI